MDNVSGNKKPVILIVDDTARNIQVVGSILKESIDCNFAFARQGEQALDLAVKANPDLILLDIMMPGMDGFEVCRRLKNDSKTNMIPVIFLTAKTATEDIVTGFELGAVDYVTKPFNSAELLARVKTQLNLKLKNDLISRQNNERKELLHILCHDLAHPFASIISVLDYLKSNRNVDEKFRDELEDDLTMAANNGLDIIELVKKLRALEEEKIKLKIERVNLKKAAHCSYMLLKQDFAEKDLDFVCDIDESLNVLTEETSFINSVLNNILSNAVKFSSEKTTVKVTTKKQDNFIVLIIEDTGIGMRKELASDIFDLSKATSRAGTRGEEGTGFGMPLVKKFIHLYNGKIEIDSRDVRDYPENSGTRVKLFLPDAAANSPDQ